MSAPRRWKDTPNAPVGVRELLSAGRPPRALDATAFERGASRVGRIGGGTAAAAAVVGVWTKVAAAAVIGMAGLGAVVTTRQFVSPEAAPSEPARVLIAAKPNRTPARPPNAESRPFVEEAPVAAAAPVLGAHAMRVPSMLAPAPLATAEVADAPMVEPPPTAAAVPAPAAAPAGLAEELALLEDARHVLARDPSASLARVAQHRSRFPRGVLAAERDLIELDALRRAGRFADARRLGRSWLDRDPSGLHAARVRAILATLPE